MREVDLKWVEEDVTVQDLVKEDNVEVTVRVVILELLTGVAEVDYEEETV